MSGSCRLWACGLCLCLGCAHGRSPDVAPAIAPFQQFVAPNVDWSTVQRIVLMPLANHSTFPRAAAELQTNLAAELQRAGRFEIVVAAREDPGARSQDVFARGQFDEVEVLRIAREYQAQAVLFGLVTQYQPYSPPRVGLSLLMISPGDGIVIASSDGLWDSREANTSTQAQNYFKQSLHWPQSVLGSDRVLESPDVFQRFVCQQIAQSLMPPTGLTIVPIDGTAMDMTLPATPPINP